MNDKTKIVLGATMSAALLFGFLEPHFPEAVVSFKRLHIFLFNLLSGGALILYYTEGPDRPPSRKVIVYFGLAALYALAAAARLYIPALVLTVPLFAIVESVRIRRFSIFPWNFFQRAPVHEKFNQASLLCLSIGLVIAALVILNNEYMHWVSMEKLTLDVFFLGYSFPISLITMSVMFSFMPRERGLAVAVMEEIGFWFVNLGVVTFFVFILFEMFVPEITAATTLFFTVIMIYGLFLARAPRVQQKAFLLSGMTFLLFTALTGLLYIAKYFEPALEAYKDYFLVLHVFVSLYGWNLSGLFVIMRWQDFPIRLNSGMSIALHWLIVLILAPLGVYLPALGMSAVLGYVALLVLVLVSRRGQLERAR